MGQERQLITEKKEWMEMRSKGETEGKVRTGITTENTKNGVNTFSFSPVSDFFQSDKSAYGCAYLILMLWLAQISQLLLKEINSELNVFNFYNHMLVAWDIFWSCLLKPSTKTRGIAVELP